MSAKRCHFDSDGWLRGPISIQHLMTPNRYDSGFAAKPQGVVQHTEDGYEQGTVATFMNPASQVSAFFSVADDGSCHQYLPVGHGYVAWSQASGNYSWRGIEDEDRTDPAVPMTAAQILTFAQILEACSAYDGFPLQITDSVNGTGLITHGDGGVPWGDHPGCPGSVRKAQRPAIIAKAKAIRKGITEVTAGGDKSLDQIAAENGTAASTILRVTAHAEGAYGPELAKWLNDVYGGTAGATAPVPAGTRLYVPEG